MRSLFLWVGLAAVLFIAAKAPGQEAVEPFNGKDLTGWKFKEPKERSHWTVGLAAVDPQNAGQIVITEAASSEPGHLVNAKARGVDAYTEQKFGDVRIDVEVLVPRGSNSGIYVMGEYEVQVFDSFGKKQLGPGDMGALYNAAPPKVNAIKEPGKWNHYVIDFRAPRFDENGRKTANAKFVKVTLNGQTLHENVEMQGPTPTGVSGKEAPTGPLMLQGDHGPVAYRSLRITPLPKVE